MITIHFFSFLIFNCLLITAFGLPQYEKELDTERLVDFETPDAGVKQRNPRDVKFSFPGQDRIPPPPTALCFRQPCNVPGGYRGPSQGRFARSAVDEVAHEKFPFMVTDDNPETQYVEPVLRLPRDVGSSAPIQKRRPHPLRTVCFRKPCNIAGVDPVQANGPHPGKYPRSLIMEKGLNTKGLVDFEVPDADARQRNPRDVRFSYPGQDRIPPPPTALCFRQPCNVPGGFRGPSQGRFARSSVDEVVRTRRSADKDSRVIIHSTKSFGPNSHGGWQSTAKVEHDIWKSNDGNSRVKGFVSHDRIDGGKFNGYKDNKFGIGYERKF